MNTNASGQFIIRNAYFKDWDSIRGIMKFGKTKFFGKTKANCIDAHDFFQTYCAHRLLVQSKETGVTVGYAEFNTYPTIPALPKNCWKFWMKHHFCVTPNIHAGNTLFLNYFVYTSANMPQLLVDVLFEVLIREFSLKNVVVIEPPYWEFEFKEDMPYYGVILKYVTTYYPREFSVETCKNVTKIHHFERDNIVNKLKYRRALPEDNDEIVEIIDMSLPELRDDLGDYYIAEELLRQDQGANIFIVAELNHQTRGFMSFNGNVDIMKVIVNYELEAYDNLIKVNPALPYHEMLIRVFTHTPNPLTRLFTKKAVKRIFANAYVGKYLVLSKQSKTSLESQHRLHVVSTGGTITTSNERFYMREELFKKFTKLDDHLYSLDYYGGPSPHNLYVRYNVPRRSTSPRASRPNLNLISNAFALQLFGMHDDVDVRRVFRFLLVGFSAYPERDICLFSMPASSKLTKCLDEMLKYCMRVPPRPNCIMDDLLYLTHRSCVFSNISIDAVTEEDVPFIRQEMQAFGTKLNPRERDGSILLPKRKSFFKLEISENEIIEDVLKDVLKNPESEYHFLIIRCGNMALDLDTMIIVGIVILRAFTHVHQLKMHFQMPRIADALEFTRAEVIMIRVHELFMFQSDFIFRRIGRLLGYWDFYYLMPTKSTFRPLCNDLAAHMQPIEPRRIKTCRRDTTIMFKVQRPSLKTLSTIHDTYALFQQNLRPTRFYGNKNALVIIGFTDTVRAFLRLMIFSWNSRDSRNAEMHCCVPKLKINVIVPPGVVEAAYSAIFDCAYCEPKSKCWVNYENSCMFIRDTIARIDLRTWITFTAGEVHAIDRVKSHVALKNSCLVHYDQLLLMCDCNYGLSRSLKRDEVLPPNYMHINNRLEKIIVYHRIQMLKEHVAPGFEATVLVYGRDLRTFEFINFLLKHGIHGRQITLAMPYNWAAQETELRFNNPCCDQKIEEILVEMIEDLHVHVYERLNFVKWHCYPRETSIKYVEFEMYPSGEPKHINCDLFVNFFEINIDKHFVDVLKEANMRVINNKIIVDDDFRTVDPKIFALGKFIEHEHSPNHQYTYVSHLEACQKLMRVLEIQTAETIGNDPKFTKARFFRAQLPMNHHLVKLTQPKRYLANHLTNEYQHALTTYHQGTFTRVRLNQHCIVEEILCVSATEECCDFLQCFIGKHESMLNNMHALWYLQEIECLLKFFKEPWAELLMHDAFDTLHDEIVQISMDAAETIVDLEFLERRERRDVMKLHAESVAVTKEVEQAFIEYLRKYRHDFRHPIALPEDFPQPLGAAKPTH